MMKEATTIREAIRQWEEESGRKAHESSEVKLIGLYPPIEKTDQTLQTLVMCEKLSLSTNAIEKVGHLSPLTNLKILSLGRNNIKSFAGLEALGDTLEQLWISYNQIEKMKGINIFKRLKVLYMSNNLVKEWSEFVKLVEVPSLEELNFVGNPLEEKHSSEGTWRPEVEKRLTFLKRLDGLPIIRDIDEATFHQMQRTQEVEDVEMDNIEATEAEQNIVDVDQMVKEDEEDDDDDLDDDDDISDNINLELKRFN